MTENKKVHEYDGIQEHDNDLPNWWIYIFYITIAFSIVYMFYYHGTSAGLSPTEEYLAEQKKIEQELQNMPQQPNTQSNEELLAVISNPENSSKGKAIFLTKCVACHADDGGGGIGPNLTDDHWIHGGQPQQIAMTIANGVPEKGMIAWGPLLTKDEIGQLVAFIKSIKGTTPKNPKAPQGEPEKL